MFPWCISPFRPQHTPAIAIFGVFVFFLILSQLLEGCFHRLDHYFVKTNQPGLRNALNKIKEELMLMGFCSVVLIAFEDQILDVCVDFSLLGGVPASAKWKCPCSYAYMQVKYPGWAKNHFTLNPNRMLGAASSAAGSNSSTVDVLQENLSIECKQWLDKDPRHEDLWRATQAGFTVSSGASGESSSATSSAASSGAASTRRMLLEALESTDPEKIDRRFVRKLATFAIDTCPAGQFPFIEQAALHQTHTIIFCIAVVHITLGCIVMWIAQKKVSRWAAWEHYGDTEQGESASKLYIPPPRSGMAAMLCGCKEQFTNDVDPATYVAIRRFYISKDKNVGNVAPEDYPFTEICATHMNNKFSEILGIKWWMWLSLGFQLILEGYGLGYYSFFSFAALTSMLVGKNIF